MDIVGIILHMRKLRLKEPASLIQGWKVAEPGPQKSSCTPGSELPYLSDLLCHGTEQDQREAGSWDGPKGWQSLKTQMWWVTQFESGCPGMTNKTHESLYSAISAVYHYQVKIHVFSYENVEETEPAFYVTLYGTDADSQNLRLEM